MCFKAVKRYLRLPHEPQFKDVHVSSTLNAFVPGVIGHVILLVRLKEILGTQLIAFLQEALRTTQGESLVCDVNKLPANSCTCSLAYLSLDQNSWALQRDAHYFVWVPGHGVRPVKAHRKQDNVQIIWTHFKKKVDVWKAGWNGRWNPLDWKCDHSDAFWEWDRNYRFWPAITWKKFRGWMNCFNIPTLNKCHFSTCAI